MEDDEKIVLIDVEKEMEKFKKLTVDEMIETIRCFEIEGLEKDNAMVVVKPKHISDDTWDRWASEAEEDNEDSETIEKINESYQNNMNIKLTLNDERKSKEIFINDYKFLLDAENANRQIIVDYD